MNDDKVRELHEALTGLDPYCLLCGGYVRDQLLGIEPRDADFYVHTPLSAEDFAAMLEPFLVHKQLSWRIRAGDITVKYDYPSPGRHGVVGATPSVDIILWSAPVSPDRIFETFDIGLCMAARDVRGVVFTSPAFSRDREQKTLTFYPGNKLTEEDREHSFNIHIPRLRRKFPDYELVEADFD